MTSPDLDPDMLEVLAHFDEQPVPAADARNPAARRRLMLERAAWLAPRPVPAATCDFLVGHPGVPVRLYDAVGSRQLPLVVFVHGGGWVTGDLETHDDLCRRLSLRAGCLVLAIDYRRTPEHPYPAALEDVSTVMDWLTGSGPIESSLLPTWDRRRLAVAGDSAGGNLTAVVAGLYRGTPGLRAQLLIYPMLDATMSFASYDDPALGVTFPRAEVAWSYDLYCQEPAQRLDWRVSPIFADASGMPPTAVVLAEFDVLRDENAAYISRLRTAGVSVEAITGRGLAHGFIRMTGRIQAAAEVLDRSCAFLRRAFTEEVPDT